MRGRWQRFLPGILLGAVLLAGCGGQPPQTSAQAKTKKKRQPSPQVAVRNATPKETVSPTAYASVGEALAAVEKESASGNPSNQELVKIETWLGMQGASAVPTLTEALKDPSRHLAVRITACRALARTGASGKSPLLDAANGEPRQLRLKATECLGRIEPTDPEIVARLAGLIHSDDFDQRKAALTALANIGVPAAKADPQLVQKLMAVLNDTSEDETIRGLAKTALKRVDPRQGLQNAH